MSEKGISRRQFVAGAAVTAAATTLPVLSNVTTAAAAVPATIAPLTKGAADWTPLDAKALARQAYEIYKGKHAGQAACCEATWWPIIGVLAARYPDTWGHMPKGVFNYGGGGINSWRSICGCTNGGSNVLKMVTNDGKAIDEYLAWYEKTLLPTNATYLDYRTTTWVAGGSAAGVWGGTGLPIPYNNAPKSKAQSVLCHSSLTNWRVVAGPWEQSKPAAQSDRCGKLCYDTVFKLATMINSWMAGATFAGALDSSIASCGETTGIGCHGSSANATTGGLNTGHPMAQGKMKCTPCHTQRLGDGHNL